jgi:hypothetical protein
MTSKSRVQDEFDLDLVSGGAYFVMPFSNGGGPIQQLGTRAFESMQSTASDWWGRTKTWFDGTGTTPDSDVARPTIGRVITEPSTAPDWMREEAHNFFQSSNEMLVRTGSDERWVPTAGLENWRSASNDERLNHYDQLLAADQAERFPQAPVDDPPNNSAASLLGNPGTEVGVAPSTPIGSQVGESLQELGAPLATPTEDGSTHYLYSDGSQVVTDAGGEEVFSTFDTPTVEQPNTPTDEE